MRPLHLWIYLPHGMCALTWNAQGEDRDPEHPKSSRSEVSDFRIHGFMNTWNPPHWKPCMHTSKHTEHFRILTVGCCTSRNICEIQRCNVGENGERDKWSVSKLLGDSTFMKSWNAEVVDHAILKRRNADNLNCWHAPNPEKLTPRAAEQFQFEKLALI